MRDAALHPGAAPRAMRAGDAAPMLPMRAEGLGLVLGGTRLIHGLDLTLAPGGITMILGPNGAGKSLLLRLLHGLIPPTEGRLTWNGAPADAALRKRQAMVFQSPVLLRRSAAANIDFVLRARGAADPARREALLAGVGLAGRGTAPARLLSGGEQQRLALARALASDPEMLFLDEPTASLDPGSVRMIEEAVRRASLAGMRIVFVTHDIAQARRLADDVLFLHAGRLAEHSPAARFFDAPQSQAARDYLAGRILD